MRRGDVNMPVWFRCTSCGQKYYTAYTSRKENECEKCGDKLEKHNK